MRSLNNNSFQTNQKHPYFASTNTETRLPSLVSQYMDMFDTSKVNASLLQKREHPSVDDFLQSELQKKVKTLMGARDCKPVNTIPNLAAMLFNQNLPLTASPFQSIPIRNLQQQTNLIRQQQQQQEALQLLQSQLQKNPLSFNHFQPTLITNNKKAFTMEEVAIKEEHTEPLMKRTSVISTIQGKVSDIMSENNTTNDGLSECSGDKDDFLMPSPIRDEPVLAEFTKAFPEWDLATIFSFMKSGKSMEVFEKERKFKIERKLKKQKKNSDAKQNKTKKTNAI